MLSKETKTPMLISLLVKAKDNFGRNDPEKMKKDDQFSFLPTLQFDYYGITVLVLFLTKFD